MTHIPFENRPAGCKDPLWRYSKNPIIDRYHIPTSNSIFNSAVVPFGDGFAGVFRCDNKAVQMNIFAGFSKDGIHWDINPDPIQFEAGNTDMIVSEYKYDPRVTWIEDRYWITWCNGYNGPTIGIGYTFDFNTRQVTAHLGLDGQGFGDLGNALDSFTGSFGVAFPLSGSQANQVALNVLQSTTQIVTSAGAIAGGVATGNVAEVYGGAVGIGSQFLGGKSIKPESMGTLTPTAGLYAPQIPYLIINRPIAALPSKWVEDMGYSAGYSGKVSSFTGYLQALQVELNTTANMTEQEQQEITNLLLGGIYCG